MDCFVLLRIDNILAETYINRLRGALSVLLTNLTRDLFHYCVERNITLQAEYLPGSSNLTADWFSHFLRDASNWKLDQSVFSLLLDNRGPLSLDLFPSRWNRQLLSFFSWLPPPDALALDAYIQPWPRRGAYAFTAFCMITRSFTKFVFTTS